MVGKGEIKFSTYERSTALIKGRFAKLKTMVEALTSSAELTPLTSVQIKSLDAYLNELKKKKADFENNFQRILEHTSSEEAPEATLSKDQDEVNDLYVLIASSIESLLPTPTDDPRTPSSETTVSTHAFPVPHQNVRLPQLELKTFDGTPNQWVSFINLFDTTVHHNASLSSVMKMQYLLSCLTHEPLNLIKSLNISAGNYIVAYNLLKDRYHNSRRLSTLHLNAILDLPSLSVGSTKTLRQFINLFLEHSQSLKALDCDITAQANPLLSAHLLRKLDQELRRKLEVFRSTQECEPHSLPTVDEIMKFLNEECAQTEDASLHYSQSSSKANYSHFSKGPKRSVTFAAELKPNQSHRNVAMLATQPSRSVALSHPCFACQQTGHKIYSCQQFQNKSPTERFKVVKSHQRCVSCLGAHTIDKCTSKSTCLKCKKNHHTLLHFEKNTAQAQSTSAPQPTPSSDLVVASAQGDPATKVHSHSTVLLGTTLVKLTASNGITHVFRALIDSGSMCSFISERATQFLATPRHRSTHTIVGISASSSQTKGYTVLELATLSNKNIAAQHTFHILDKISADLPRTALSPEVMKRVKPFVLADPTFHLPGGIDVLLGCALFPLLLTHETHSLGNNMPHLIGTKFGFVVMGNAPCVMDDSPVTRYSSLLSINENDLHSSLQKFWIQEEVPQCTKQSAEERLCDLHFSQTHTRTSDGRYIVRLPFKADSVPLGKSHPAAEKRLHSLERKFIVQPSFHELYKKFMEEYQTLGHMTKLDKPNINVPESHYYLPHHGVLKECSSSTKLRTVFDGSSKTSTGVSLNDVLLTGRKLQTNICDILLNFRRHNIVFTCDIRQMYRQIFLHPDDQMFQLVLWRDDLSQEISTYKLNTVTYGLNSSPYLAIRTLHQLAEDEGAIFPEAAKILKSQTYVDDCICGADNVSDALELQNQLIKLLKRGGFELRKWSSNSPELLQALPPEHLESPVFLESSQQPHYSILGLHWSPVSDSFSYSLNLPHESSTKRHVLSLIAKIYDPCGFLAPCIMLAKCFMQLLWTTGLNWDDPLPHELDKKWQNFVTDAQVLSSIQIPRTLHFSDPCSLELHGFSDASECGFAAVLYCRCELSNGDVIIRQILAKTRVAPLKKVTLPRLELCAAHLLAQVAAYCLSVFKDKLDLNHTYLWCDSSVALTWLQTPPFKLKTYVANRVAQTQELVPPHCWHYIQSRDNPADCASRGLLASQLQDHPLWWTGPPWLSLSHDSWPNRQFTPVDVSAFGETKQNPLSVFLTEPEQGWELLTKFSSWLTLLHVMGYILRFLHNSKGVEKRRGALTPTEMRTATTRIIRLIQASSFAEEISALKRQEDCGSKLRRLSPLLDSDGVLRVGGRLKNAPLSYEAIHPALLPKQHHCVDLIVDFYHKIHLHAGPQLTQSLISQKFWILTARQVIRSRIFKCITCFKNKPRNVTPLMGDLPSSRVTPVRPFSSSGIDFCGPFSIKIYNLRAVRHVKAYLCIFVCLATKAVHLEVVTDLTTEAFIASLTRFVSRRGLCLHIFSDCGTNFIGANSALQKIISSIVYSTEAQSKIHHFSTPRGITFHFNPPAAPHQGGLWEGAVKSAKHHLRRVMGDTVLTLMEFITLSTQIEAMLNSRPLTQLSSDPSDCSALTPGHFLTGDSLAALPEPDHHDVPVNRLKQWQLVQSFHQRIWKRWQLEYLHTLQQRSKWNKQTPNLKVGELVMIHTNCPPLSWPLARVTAVHPGSDGVVRVVDLKTPTGLLTRPAIKVYPLPMN